MPLRDLECNLRQCFLCGEERRAVPERAVGAQNAGECLAERAAGLGDLGFGVAGSQLERKLEPSAAGEQREQVIENRDARGDVRRARA